MSILIAIKLITQHCQHEKKNRILPEERKKKSDKQRTTTLIAPNEMM